MELIRQFGLEGAARARGATVIADTFRAFTTCAFAFSSGAARIVLAEEVDEARDIASGIDGAILSGEDKGVKPSDFAMGNSPAEMLAADLRGHTLVHRTSAGTRCVRAAVAAGARPVWATSLVVAAATWSAIAPYNRVIVVPAGRYGSQPVAEDEGVLEYLRGKAGAEFNLDRLMRELRNSESAERLATAPWAHPDDLDLCLDVDRFDFAMRVVRNDGLVELQPTI